MGFIFSFLKILRRALYFVAFSHCSSFPIACSQNCKNGSIKRFTYCSCYIRQSRHRWNFHFWHCLSIISIFGYMSVMWLGLPSHEISQKVHPWGYYQSLYLWKQCITRSDHEKWQNFTKYCLIWHQKGYWSLLSMKFPHIPSVLLQKKTNKSIAVSVINLSEISLIFSYKNLFWSKF